MSVRLPIGSYNDRFGVTLSLPSIVGRGGVVRTFEPEMSRNERQALELGAAGESPKLDHVYDVELLTPQQRILPLSTNAANASSVSSSGTLPRQCRR